ncbi:MAG: hypothetical protein PHH87_02360 [Desulfuromonas sp.]|nr:hypothetical protein [Desulfuromonas sp.]
MSRIEVCSLTLCFLVVLAGVPGFASGALAAIYPSPSQVLVLYNADWHGDEPLTAPGQDSLEIATHYVDMHTDQTSGEKPYILGLHCKHGIKIIDKVHHLDSDHLAEDSADNQAGVVFKRNSLFGPTLREDQLRDSSLVEFVLPGGHSSWQMDSLQMTLVPEKGKDLVLVKDGSIVAQGKIALNSTDAWTVRLDGKSFAAGTLTLKASCTDKKGKVHSWKADYVDIDAVELSHTGRDGKRDDKNFLEDVAQPVKEFLEDPQHARPDGTLLKDHILFMVVCYGLPRTAVAPYGIARGITNQINNFGSILDFGQRLQLLYYDLDKVSGCKIQSYRFAGKEPFSAYFLRSPQAWPLLGTANLFAHPQLYTANPTFDSGPQPLAYTVANRSQHPERFLYFVSRIDAPDPLQAKTLIGRAVYASTYASPNMGILPEQGYPQTKKRTGYLSRSKTGMDLWEQGYRHLYYGGKSKNLLEWGRLAPEEGFLNEDTSYLPGGVAATVISHNGWNKGEMRTDLARGVSATAGAAKVYRGAPHIHNKSWWDDAVFYPALSRGKTLGEAWLMNQMNLGWITTFVGDPLMKLPATPILPHAPKYIDADNDVSFQVVKGAHAKEVWLQVDLGTTAAHPQVAQLQAVSPEGKKMISPTFDARPTLYLGDKAVCGENWLLTLMDPFGRKYTQSIVVDCVGTP